MLSKLLRCYSDFVYARTVYIIIQKSIQVVSVNAYICEQINSFYINQEVTYHKQDMNVTMVFVRSRWPCLLVVLLGVLLGDGEDFSGNGVLGERK